MYFMKLNATDIKIRFVTPKLFISCFLFLTFWNRDDRTCNKRNFVNLAELNIFDFQTFVQARLATSSSGDELI